MEARDPDQVAEAKAIALKFGMEPTPRHLGGDPRRLEIVEDRGTFSTVETEDLEMARGAAAAARAIRCLPRDHLEFAQRSKLHQDSPWRPTAHAIVNREQEQELGRCRVALEDTTRMYERRPATVRSGCGLKARALRRGDPELQEVHTAASAHLCGPGPRLFPSAYTPRRGAALP